MRIFKFLFYIPMGIGTGVKIAWKMSELRFWPWLWYLNIEGHPVENSV